MISAQHHHSSSPISVRSHGEARKAKSETKTFQSVIGPLDLVPRNRLRVIRRNEPNNDETIQAAKAAGLVAKNLQEKTSRQRIDFDLSDNKFSPVSFPHFFFLFLRNFLPTGLPTFFPSVVFFSNMNIFSLFLHDM